MAYNELFSPLKVGNVTIRNRIMSTAHVTNFAYNGEANEQHMYYLAEKAKGGIGLIVMEGVRVHHSTHIGPKAIAGYDPSCIPSFKKVTDEVHKYGATIFMQILHMGRQTVSTDMLSPLWAPSSLPCPTKKEIPHAMTLPEIEEVIEGFAKSAVNAKAAGFDGVEIHGAHGYLPQQFFSPLSNHRTDKYGGSLENRVRFALEVINAVREAVGPDFVVGMRISGDEFADGGLTLDDMMEIAPILAATGKLDFLDVSHCSYNTPFSFSTMIPDMHFPPAPFTYIAAGIKSVVTDIPVFTVGRITDPSTANNLVANGQADMVGMTRATICDPFLPQKAKEGRDDDIRSCISCNQGCVGRMHAGHLLSCIQNPATGREKEWGVGTIKRTEKKKKVLVIGAGPAGMEAAHIAAERGHDVTIWDARDEVGGDVMVAALIPQRSEFGGIQHNMLMACEKQGVKIERNKLATADDVLAFGPDAVIVATGSQPITPEYEGAAESSIPFYSPDDIAKGAQIDGDRVVVVDDDGTFRATSIAEYLAEGEKEVIIVTGRAMEGDAIIPASRNTMHTRLMGLGVRVISLKGIKRIDGNDVVTFDPFIGEEGEIIEDVAAVVVAGKRKPVDELYHALYGKVPELKWVGDCVAPRTVFEAIREGHAAGLEV